MKPRNKNSVILAATLAAIVSTNANAQRVADTVRTHSYVPGAGQGVSNTVRNARYQTESAIRDDVEYILQHGNANMNLFDQHKAGLSSKILGEKKRPWSGSYWPDIVGGIANQYRKRPASTEQFLFFFRYLLGIKHVYKDFENVRENFDSYTKEELADLSPTQKYDLLMGYTDFRFSEAVLDENDFRYWHKYRPMLSSSEGDYWYAREGMPYWSGICDGWVPSAVSLPRPTKPVVVRGALGHEITFYPDDVKALGAYLYARTNTPYFASLNYRYAGERCRKRFVGKMKDGMESCGDIDAGVWHSLMVNRIAVDGTGFVIDVDNNHKVNNHPVAGYENEYFDVVTGKVGGLRESLRSKSEISSIDPWADKRNPGAKYIVGVKMKMHYMNYYWVKPKKTHADPSEDKMKDRKYIYDLELAADGTILGGKFRNTKKDRRGKQVADQPDFVWMAGLDQLPFTEFSKTVYGGSKIDESSPKLFGNMNWAWDGKSQMPLDWKDAAQADLEVSRPKLGERGGQMRSAVPLSQVVFYLFDRAK